MDKKVFNDLMNKNVITTVGLDSEKYTDLKDLQNKGIVTGIDATEEYAKATAEEDIVVEEEAVEEQ